MTIYRAIYCLCFNTVSQDQLGRNDCCVVDCFPGWGASTRHIGARRLSLGRVDSGALRVWGASTGYQIAPHGNTSSTSYGEPERLGLILPIRMLLTKWPTFWLCFRYCISALNEIVWSVWQDSVISVWRLRILHVLFKHSLPIYQPNSAYLCSQQLDISSQMLLNLVFYMFSFGAIAN